jgi:hypothetical protein
VRTPKHGAAPRRALYRSALRGWPGIELLLAAWFGWGSSTRRACTRGRRCPSSSFFRELRVGRRLSLIESVRNVRQAHAERRRSESSMLAREATG